MRILVDIGHPAHVHFFKNIIWKLEERGHEVKITAREKEVALQLLNIYGFEYENVGKNRIGTFNKALGMFEIDRRICKIAKKFKTDILTGINNPYVAQVGKLIGKPSIVFDDTEHAKLINYLAFPFATAICTPACFQINLGRKQVRYNGYHELAYLHPNYFTPNSKVLDEIGLTKDDRFIILRFVSWDASHDTKCGVLSHETRRILIRELGRHGRILISSEKKLQPEFEKYRITLSPEKIHDLLYFASMYVGDGATMATEAGVLGTPSVYTSPLSGLMGNLVELEKKYKLLYSYRDMRKAIKRATGLLKNGDLKASWWKKRKTLLEEKIDVTKFVTEFIEHFPEEFLRV